MQTTEGRVALIRPCIRIRHSAFCILHLLKMSDAASSPLLLVISAPSAGGKTTLCQQLLASRKDVVRAITCTTREPRVGEKDGVDYYFLDAETFLKRVQAGDFLEHATVHGNSYGTLK